MQSLRQDRSWCLKEVVELPTFRGWSEQGNGVVWSQCDGKPRSSFLARRVIGEGCSRGVHEGKELRDYLAPKHSKRLNLTVGDDYRAGERHCIGSEENPSIRPSLGGYRVVEGCSLTKRK